jgi:hypothetical protein
VLLSTTSVYVPDKGGGRPLRLVSWLLWTLRSWVSWLSSQRRAIRQHPSSKGIGMGYFGGSGLFRGGGFLWGSGSFWFGDWFIGCWFLGGSGFLCSGGFLWCRCLFGSGCLLRCSWFLLPHQSLSQHQEVGWEGRGGTAAAGFFSPAGAFLANLRLPECPAAVVKVLFSRPLLMAALNWG